MTVVDGQGETHRFDQVVLACHADQALRLLEQPDIWEERLLGAFPTSQSGAAAFGRALMPRRRRVWSSWNYLSGADVSGERAVSVTYWMNRLQGLPDTRNYFVTLNP